MNYSSVDVFESKLSPGLIYKLRRISHGRRVQLNLDRAPVFAKLAEIDRELRPIQEEISRATEAAKIEPCTCGKCSSGETQCAELKIEDGLFARGVELEQKRLFVIIDELYPMYLRWGVKSIDGLEIDGKPATVESMIEDGPEPLVAEVAGEIIRLTKLSPDEQLGFKQPGTSGAPVAGQTPNSSAPPADATSASPSEAAAA